MQNDQQAQARRKKPASQNIAKQPENKDVNKKNKKGNKH